MKKVIMLLAKDLESYARVCNEAKSLLKNGYDVTVVAWDREVCSPKKEMQRALTQSTWGCPSQKTENTRTSNASTQASPTLTEEPSFSKSEKPR
jgi:hypothetical protein